MEPNRNQPNNPDLFNQTRDKALMFPRHYLDEKLDELLTLISEKPRETYFLGSGNCKDSTFHYLLTLWKQEAVVGVKDKRETNETTYSFFHVGLDEKGKLDSLRGIYSTCMGKKEDRFNRKMGSVIMDNSGKGEQLFTGFLVDVLGSKVDSGNN